MASSPHRDRVARHEPHVAPVDDRWAAFSDATGLIELAATRESAIAAYHQSLEERRPLDFPWTDAPRQPLTFDGSVFHPLDHWVATAVCRGWHGGAWRHVELWWEYQALRPEVVIANVRCRIGRHVPTDTWTRSPTSGQFLNRGGRCAHCYAWLPRTWMGRRPVF